MNNIIDICNKYNINIIYNDKLCCDAIGIGDILFRLLCIKNKLVITPFYINLLLFTTTEYYSNPCTNLEFRIKLINDIIKNNNINVSNIIYIYSNNNYINQYLPYKTISKFNLNFNEFDEINDNKIINLDEYIIFHTKLRHNSSEDYNLLKINIKLYCKTFKSKYKIYILGEQTFPNNQESQLHKITTIYDELLNLKNNNNVLDLSVDNIYDNLNYDNYKKDINLISNAKYNICFGQGGQLCTSLIFGKSTIFYYKIDNIDLDNNYLLNNNHFHCNTITNILDTITSKCSL